MGEDPKILIEKAKTGDKQAFEELYRLFYTPVYRYIRLRVRNKAEAEDLAQTVFFKVYSALPRFEYGNSAPLAYFFTVARNTVIDHWRKSGRVIYDDDILINKESELAEKSGAEIKETKEMIFQAMESLTDDQRDIITYKFLHELGTHEIAEMLGKSEEAVRQLQSRALKSLRSYFKEHHKDL
jgi:RNA polymerase sigma-70 factor (ECF subfamily)